MTVGCGDGLTHDLVNADQQFRWRRRAEHFVNETVDRRITISVDRLGPEFLFGQTFTQHPCGVGMIENMAAGLELYLVVRNREGP